MNTRLLVDFMNKHFKATAAISLGLLNALILFNQDDYLYSQFGGEFVSNYDVMSFLVFTYICLLFAAFIKNIQTRQALINLSFFSAVFALLPLTQQLFVVKGRFYRYTNEDYWHILTLTLLGMFLLAALFLLAKDHFHEMTSDVREHLLSPIKGQHKIIGALLSAPLYVLLVGLVIRFIPNLYVDYPFLSDYIYQLVRLAFEYVTFFAIATLGLTYAKHSIINWLGVAKSWLQYLSDFSMTTYLTRRISSVLYGFSYIALFGIIGLLVPFFLYDGLLMGDIFRGIGYLGPIAFFPVSALVAGIVWFFSILIIRLVYEFSNAIIHIAENTTQK